MARYIPDEIEAYSERYTTARFDLFDRLGAETRETQTAPQMMVGVVEGAFLAFLVAFAQARRVLEVGTFTGWSSIAMARALPPGGSLVTCDIDEETSAVARRYAEEAGVADRIEYRVGPAIETLATLDGPFDFAFIDADKANLQAYFERCLKLVRRGGLVAIDNTLWHGSVVQPRDRSVDALAVRAFNRRLRADRRVEIALVPIGDGLTLAWKR
jgi:predicted O-methyltransferase YrrM